MQDYLFDKNWTLRYQIVMGKRISLLVICAFVLAACGGKRNIDYADRARRLGLPGDPEGYDNPGSTGRDIFGSVYFYNAMKVDKVVKVTISAWLYSSDQDPSFIISQFYFDLQKREVYASIADSNGVLKPIKAGIITCQDSEEKCDSFYAELKLEYFAYQLPFEAQDKTLRINYKRLTQYNYKLYEIVNGQESFVSDLYTISFSALKEERNKTNILIPEYSSSIEPTDGMLLDFPNGLQGTLCFRPKTPQEGFLFEKVLLVPTENVVDPVLSFFFYNPTTQIILEKKYTIKDVQN